jgi:hypothetical protein
MAELKRIVEINTGGRPMVVLDVEQIGSTSPYRLIRDQFKPPASAPQLQMVPSARPRTAPVSVGRTDPAGTVTGTWWVAGTTYEECIGNVERLLSNVDSGNRERYIEWKPSGAARSVYMLILGAGTYTPNYQSLVFFQNKAMTFDISWPVDSYPTELPWDVTEEWVSPNAKPRSPVTRLGRRIARATA